MQLINNLLKSADDRVVTCAAEALEALSESSTRLNFFYRLLVKSRCEVFWRSLFLAACLCRFSDRHSYSSLFYQTFLFVRRTSSAIATLPP